MNAQFKYLVAPLLALTAALSIATTYEATGTPLSRSEQASLHGAGTDYDEILPADLAAMYQENAYKLSSMRITWTVVSDTSPSTENAKAKKTVGESLLQKEDLPEEARTSIQKDLARTQQSINTPSPVISSQHEFISNRDNFQIRSPFNSDTSAPFSFGQPETSSFPDVAATTETLTDALSHFHIMSAGSETNGTFRIWEGRTLAGRHSARVAQTNPYAYSFYPPLALPHDDWDPDHTRRSPIDSLYQHYLTHGTARVIGEYRIDGHDTVLIEATLADAFTLDETSGIMYDETVKAFIDINASGIPRRLEYYYEIPEDAKTFVGEWTAHAALKPYRIISGIEIATHSLNDITIHYPVRGTIERTTRAPSAKVAISTLHPDVAIAERRTWNIDSLASNPELAAGFFELPFPADTVFVNEPTNELLTTGDVEGYITRFTQRPGKDDSRAPWHTYAVFPTAVACIVAIGYVALRRRTHS